MSDNYITLNLDDLLVGEALPVAIYIYLDFRFITYRAEGDVIDRATFDRLQFKKVRNLFVTEKDSKKFKDWSQMRNHEQKPPPLPPELKQFGKLRQDMHRKAFDIFHSEHTDRAVTQALASSKKMVDEVMKAPYAIKTLGQLQTYSQGTVDHSVNVSVLAVYLAMQMGYTHSVILQHVGVGALLHDIGKPKVEVSDSDTPEQLEVKMRDHIAQGVKLLEQQGKVPNEVKLIVAQHHECYDGTGFPKKLRGQQIYDLAKIVSIANVFDSLVGDGQGPLVDRQKNAIKQLDEVLFKKFDPVKLEKALKILKLGI